jgi:prepilin-type N-terminal cleavage/methylation domain-containing protein
MMPSSGRSASAGFSLVELLTALAVFLVICAVAFELLTMAMKRYQSESQTLNAFQEARFGLDQMVRDIDDSGYPSLDQFTTTPANPTTYAVSPIAWSESQGYPSSLCTFGVANPCLSTPGDFDLILETKVNVLDPSPTVQWIRYQLQGTTLYRAVVNKDASNDPDNATTGKFVPYVQNVMNSSGTSVPIFTYTCETPVGPVSCSLAGDGGSPENIRSIGITLIVRTQYPDQQTGQYKLVEIKGRAAPIN